MLWWLPLAAIAAPRPPAAAWEDSPAGLVRCHVERAADTWRCPDVFVAVSKTWEPAFVDFGLPAPLTDGDLGGSALFDVYLTYEAAGEGAMVVACDGQSACEDAAEDPAVFGASGFLRIDARTDKATIERLVTTGLVRAAWMGIDAAETAPPFVAGTAAMVNQRLDPTAAPPIPAIREYQSFPWASALLHGNAFLYEEYGFWADYDTGAWLWVASHEGFSAQIDVDETVELWKSCSQPGPVNEPDVLDAWGQLRGGDWTDAMLSFASERARLGTAQAPPWMPEMDPRIEAWREGVVPVPPATLEPAYPPYPLGVSMWDVTASAGATLTFELESDVDTRWAFVFVDPTGVTTTTRAEPGERGLQGNYTPGDQGVLTVVVANLGPEGFDADDPLEPAPFVLTVRPDSDEANEPEPTHGTCACSGGPGSASALLLLPWLGRRRQRAQPRSCGSSLP